MGPDRPEGLSLRVLPPVSIALASALLLASACDGGSGASDGSEKVRVVTSLEIFADMVRNVGVDRVEVEALLPSGADPHTFELPPSAVREIAEADVVFINGLGLEEGLEDVIEENATGRVIELSEKKRPLENDPHMWLDAQLARSYVQYVRIGLLDVDPSGSTEYHANADEYLAQLDALDDEMIGTMGSIPAANRKLVTFHDAFAYLAHRYGLEVVAVVAPSPGQEPSAKDIAELTATIERENVPAVFKEPQFNSDVLEAAAGDAGVRVLDLLSDAYIEGVDTYIELMEFNMRQLVEGLGGS